MPATTKTKEPTQQEPQAVDENDPPRNWQEQYESTDELPAPQIEAVTETMQAVADQADRWIADHRRAIDLRELRRLLVRAFTAAIADAVRDNVEWPRRLWMFVQRLDYLAKRLLNEPDWWHDGGQFPMSVAVTLLPQCAEAAEFDAPPVKHPRVEPLPTIKELQEQGLTFAQIARLVDWKLPGGTIMADDVARVSRCLNGQEVWPTHLNLPPEADPDGWPQSQPTLDHVVQLCEELTQGNAILLTGADREDNPTRSA